MSFGLAWAAEARETLRRLDADLAIDVRAKVLQLTMDEDLLGREGRQGRFYSFALHFQDEEWRFLVRYWIDPVEGTLTVSTVACARTD